jgi:hypothetical protein
MATKTPQTELLTHSDWNEFVDSARALWALVGQERVGYGLAVAAAAERSPVLVFATRGEDIVLDARKAGTYHVCGTSTHPPLDTVEPRIALGYAEHYL